MKSFALKSILWGSLVLMLHLLVANYANGTTDTYYYKYTSDSQKYLIIGTSLASQGLRPEYINEQVGLDSEEGFFNYAFTLGHSPYGAAYRESLSRKVDSENDEGLFIVCVDPWNISEKANRPVEEMNLKENREHVGTTHFVSMYPNYEYLLENYPHGWFKLLWKHLSPSPSIHELHKDGWLHIDLPMDSSSHNKRVEAKIKSYKNNCVIMTPSEYRREELEKTILMLQERGTVFLVKLPVGKEITALERDFMPSFDSYIEGISSKYKLPYFDMRTLADTFRHVDGNHLYHESAITVSKEVGRFIREHRAINGQ